jgi:ADP-dependent NAD(P)H-hydrate dehydratase / NAD(P)H-hydrate epimerase
LAGSAGPFVGRLEVTGDVGLASGPAPEELAWTLPEDFREFPPRREVVAHKGSFGHLAILAGSMGYHGAAVLAARGAQRARPGLITVLTTQNAYYSVAAQCQAVMVRPWTPDQAIGDNYTALVIGPGLAGNDVPDGLVAVLRRLWRDARFPILIDASGLGMLAPEPTPKNALRVLTPHPGEAGLLLKNTPAQVQASRVASLRQLSLRFGHPWVVLKGHQTLVGSHEGPVYANCSGGPHLAQGGSGDLLAGYLGGLLAQPHLQADPLRAIRYAVWQHGAAADELESRRPNWILEELAAELGLASAAAR